MWYVALLLGGATGKLLSLDLLGSGRGTLTHGNVYRATIYCRGNATGEGGSKGGPRLRYAVT